MPTNAVRHVKRLSAALAVVLGVCAVLYASLHWWVHRTVRARIADAAEQFGSTWVDPASTTIVVDLWSRSAQVVGLEWKPLTVRDSSSIGVDGRVDSLIVRGVALGELLFGNGLRVDGITLAADHVNLFLPRDTNSAAERSGGMRMFSCGELAVRSGPISIFTMDSAVTRAEVSRIDGRSLAYALRGNAPPGIDFAELDASVAGVQRTPFADSTLFVDSLALHGSAGILRLTGIRFGVQDVIHTARTIKVERDVIAGVVDHITVSGLDPKSAVDGLPICAAIRIGRASLQVARDKVLRDPAFAHKPLPARMMRMLPNGAGVDSVLLEQLDVVYHERMATERGFAHIPFDSISAVMTGLRNTAGDTIVLQAAAIVLGRTPVTLTLRSAVADSSDRMEVDASVGGLAFTALAPVLTALTGIATREGRLDTLILRMQAGERQASARCWMRYDGLKLGRHVNKNKLLDPVVNGLLNVVVKRGRTGEKEGDGWRAYAWQRQQDRSLFNYLWSGVREGAKASMLTGAVLKQASR